MKILKIFGDINMKFAFYTLGCKVNQYETQAMEQKLLALGHTLGSFDEPVSYTHLTLPTKA